MAPKRRDPRNKKWHLLRCQPDVRQRLTDAQVAELGETMQKTYGWDAPPRYFQLEGARAQLEGVDMIIQAPTGFGKTAVAAGPHLWPESKGKITIVISPLMALEEEMVHTFKRDFGLEAIAVHNQNGGCSQATVNKLLSDQYQVLLISPEMILSPVFIERVLRNPRFSRKVLSMVVDEAHCISHWGADFRKKYGSLGIVRTFLPKDTAFTKGRSRFINIGNDRSNVSMVNITSGKDIPKTWIYVDNINTGSEIMDHLRTVLLARNPQIVEDDEYSNILRPFNAVMSLEYRHAAGMGCDIPDIEVVVQWMLPRTFSNWVQRAGRAARSRSRTGLAVLLVPRTVYAKIIDPNKSFSTQTVVESKPTSHTTKKKARAGPTPKEYAIAHGALRGGSKKLDGPPTARQPTLEEDAVDEGLTVFVQSTTCRREITARAFEAPLDRSAVRVPCCDICDPTLFDKVRPGPYKSKRKGKTLQRDQAIQAVEQKLREWRRMVFRRDHEFALFEPKSILDDSTITTLASHGKMTREKFTHLVSSSWLWWNDYGEELLRFMEGIGDIPFVPLPSANVSASKRSAAMLSEAELLTTAGGGKRPRRQTELHPSPAGESIFVNLSAESFNQVSTPRPLNRDLYAATIRRTPNHDIPYNNESAAPHTQAGNTRHDESSSLTMNLFDEANAFATPQRWSSSQQQTHSTIPVYPVLCQPNLLAARNGQTSREYTTPAQGPLSPSHYYPTYSPLTPLTAHSAGVNQPFYAAQSNFYPTPSATPLPGLPNRGDTSSMYQTLTHPPSRTFEFRHYSPSS
ncbi:P-loop containing nucleoside triphosphate hydrolase protein [Panus rudis PR-1116 ss-1]|nr:P-loop containing nucleoside triphosphate hydrolase protein [Panus rudis PR-1116 ss-1]